VIRRIHALLLQIFRRLPRRARLFVVHRLAPGFSVGAICLVERSDGALLLVQHSYRRNWGFPGGLAKRGEDIGTAARREALEEVNLPIELVGEPAVVVDPDAKRVDVVFRARPAGDADLDAVRPSSPEVVELRWFPQTALPDLQPEAASALVALARSARSPQATPLVPGGRRWYDRLPHPDGDRDQARERDRDRD
jgi:8-oxo-dGTP diphosphatase